MSINDTTLDRFLRKIERRLRQGPLDPDLVKAAGMIRSLKKGRYKQKQEIIEAQASVAEKVTAVAGVDIYTMAARLEFAEKRAAAAVKRENTLRQELLTQRVKR